MRRSSRTKKTCNEKVDDNVVEITPVSPETKIIDIADSEDEEPTLKMAPNPFHMAAETSPNPAPNNSEMNRKMEKRQPLMSPLE